VELYLHFFYTPSWCGKGKYINTAAKHSTKMGDLMFQDIEVIARPSGYMDRLVKETTQYTHPKISSRE